MGGAGRVGANGIRPGAIDRDRVWDATDPEGKRSFAPTGDSMANPFGENAHGLAGGGVELRFAPGAGFGEADAVEMGDHQLHAGGGADEHDAHGFARVGGLCAWGG